MEHRDVSRRWRRITAVMSAIFMIALAFCGIWIGLEPAALPVTGPAGEGRTVLVIDPGHGGEDGGASTAAGVKESGLNLQIALRLDDVMHLFGVETLMTRREDVSIHSAEAVTLRQKKTSDLKNRVALLNGQADAFLVSIHQNCFGAAQYSGAQVFFSADDPVGAETAVYTQECLRLALDRDNARQAAVISDSVYLMKHSEHSGILVECGFLSNAREAELLQSDAYQLDIAKAIAVSLLTHGDL